jgi:ABC-type phosphate transport system substrate-binding protein
LCFLICIPAPPIVGDLCAEEDGVVVIAHTSVPVDMLSQKEVRRIFLGRKTTWENKTTIRFATLKQGTVHEAFLRRYVKKTPRQFNNYWKKLIFTGKARASPTFDTPEDLIQYVAKTQGALGYAPSENVGADVRIVSPQRR